MKEYEPLIHIYQKCIEKWGYNSQFEKAVEEFAELIVAIKHMNKTNKPDIDSVMQEMAQCELLIGQLKYIFSLYMGTETSVEKYSQYWNSAIEKTNRYLTEE